MHETKGKLQQKRSSDQHHRLRRLCVLALLLEGGLVVLGEYHTTAVHLPGMQQLGLPRPFPACCGRRRGLSGRRRRARRAGSGAGDAALGGEVAVLVRVVVEPGQLCSQSIASRSGAARQVGRSCRSRGEECLVEKRKRTNLWAACRRRGVWSQLERRRGMDGGGAEQGVRCAARCCRREGWTPGSCLDWTRTGPTTRGSSLRVPLRNGPIVAAHPH